MRLAGLAVSVVVAAAGCDQTTNVEIALDYSAGQHGCPDSANTLFFEARHTIAFHVLDPSTGDSPGVLISECIDVEPAPFRSLPSLYLILDERLPKVELPLDVTAIFELVVFQERIATCQPFRGDGVALEFGGRSSAVDITADLERVVIPIVCTDQL